MIAIAIIGGYITLSRATEASKEFFYFSLIAIAGFAIQAYLYQKDKQKASKSQ